MQILAALTLYEVALAQLGWPVIWLGNAALLAGLAIGLWRFWYQEFDVIRIFVPEIKADAQADSHDDDSHWTRAA